MSNAKAIGRPMSPSTSLAKDEQGTPVDENKYREMIGSLLYLTASRPDIMFSVCKYARFQSAPKESHLTAVKRIIRSHWDCLSWTMVIRKTEKSTSGACQLLGKALISWNSKKQASVALSTTKAEYIAIGQ
ncbi:PREDICTED: uncharacterized protein LOC109232565 [Nicotiana attenuata]|uniref:uncharacterized protein LOC109232565 n=1 Tax=Nicotiana attenuata TaxID=49451 RepID=UPI000905CA20|nr:PREDICTED: uncharacterized protein LOC109232565 [Nicotiana attenuata]